MVPAALQYERKVWGEVAHVFASDQVAVSHLRVMRGYRCSRHFHRHRRNSFAVLSGSIAIDEWTRTGQFTETLLMPGRVHTVPAGVTHRFRVLSSGQLIEVYTPDCGGSVRLDDIERLDEGGEDAN